MKLFGCSWQTKKVTTTTTKKKTILSVVISQMTASSTVFSSLFGFTTMRTHYNDVIMSAMVSQITSLTIVYSTIYSGADKKTPKLRVTLLCVGNSPVTGVFPAQMTSNVENVSIGWRHHDKSAHYWLLLSGMHLINSSQKCPIMWKVFQCHNATMECWHMISNNTYTAIIKNKTYKAV